MNVWTAIAAGVCLGLVHFGGLRWTIEIALSRRRPTAWLMLSRAVRLALAAVFFVVAARCGPPAIFGGLAGFWAARTWLVYRLGGLRHAST